MSTATSIRPEALQAAAMSIINLDPTTKALRLHEANGRTVELGVAGAVLFCRYGGLVYAGVSWINPDDYDADGKSHGCCGTPLHKVVEFFRNGSRFADGEMPSMTPLAYFQNLEETSPTSISLRLIFRSPFLRDPTAEHFIEETVDFHRMPASA